MRATAGRHPRIAAGAGLLALMVSVSSGCGYALAGRGNALPAHIRLIGVPEFENTTPYPDLERIVTESVRSEFQSRGRFRVQPEAGGMDAVLTGRIIRLDLVPATLTTSLQASRYIVSLVVAVEFRDQTNNNDVIWANPSMTFRDEFDVPSTASGLDPTAAFRQDVNAVERLAKNFARTAVTSILEAF
ncbi:MAG TPA: LPS assembly lipoprotein LptE [Vicinamibacterales bacterium]|nr:LPS assembly lipoprotein LptE [Vicinamibacterales bacterium]